jgi:spermidine synthase
MALWYDEIHDNEFRIGMRVKDILYRDRSEFQRIDIVETEALGRALLLDGVWMTSEGDEKFYHEYIVHPAMNIAPSIERVLVIGGGDGGTVREVLRYDDVKHVDMVEIDGKVVEACKEFLPTIGSSWDDPRLTVTIGDGIDYVKHADVEPYDVVIVDGSDPVGPAEGLFNRSFFEGCRRILSDDGVFVAQAESPDYMQQIHLDMLEVIDDVFDETAPFYGGVNIYPGAWWGWILATRGLPTDRIEAERARDISEQTMIYNESIHRAAFAVPNFIRRKWKR